jgi:hypothetical protein
LFLRLAFVFPGIAVGAQGIVGCVGKILGLYNPAGSPWGRLLGSGAGEISGTPCQILEQEVQSSVRRDEGSGASPNFSQSSIRSTGGSAFDGFCLILGVRVKVEAATGENGLEVRRLRANSQTVLPKARLIPTFLEVNLGDVRWCAQVSEQLHFVYIISDLSRLAFYLQNREYGLLSPPSPLLPRPFLGVQCRRIGADRKSKVSCQTGGTGSQDQKMKVLQSSIARQGKGPLVKTSFCVSAFDM